MIGDHLERRAVKIARAGGRGRRLDQGLEQIDIVIAVHALHHRRHALETHTGVYRRPGQRAQRAVRGAVVLHKDQVPDLDIAIAVLVRRARRPAFDLGPWS